MRTKIYNPRSELMRHGIREMVELANQLRKIDPECGFIGENIGDPVVKGWTPPGFINEILKELIDKAPELAFGYTNSRGNLEARQWVAMESRRTAPASRLDHDHVLFTNGLAAAISVLYRMLAPSARIIQPNPGYPAHISNERFASGAPSIGYRLDIARGWKPDWEHLESQIRKHPEVAGFLLINPNNPTGTVYNADDLEVAIGLAEKYNLMLISDEVYYRMVFNGEKYTHLTQLAAGRVPLVVMRGLSKDVPWPGSRCGWLEFHNTELDPDFAAYVDSIRRPLMVEVCATSLPQAALPRIYNHPLYQDWLAEYNSGLAIISNRIYDILRVEPGLLVNRIHGAFYMTIVFKPEALNSRQHLPISNNNIRRYMAELTSNTKIPLDKRFAFYLLAATGICVVPASDFESPWSGFRVTTLDRDPVRSRNTYQTLGQSVRNYLASA